MRASLLLVVLSLFAPMAAAGFPATAPNDPNYASSERSAFCEVSVNSEQHNLYSFMPKCAPFARDPEGASGMSVDLAWKRTIGDPRIVIAYVEAGINWHADSARDLVNQVWLNAAELPLPAGCAAYDCNGDGLFNVKDYASDPRAVNVNGNAYLDPEDLIVAFSDGVDDDANGFVDDISGWDFYDGQNDPATYDATYDHANGQMRRAAAETNNGIMGAGICPLCRILPVKAGAEALDRTDDLARAWRYAADRGARVIVSVTADLGYSSLMRETVDDLWSRGVIMVEASNDFDSLDHQGGMWWPHVLPGNGLVTNTQGQPDPASTFLGTTTYRARSDETSWGTHAMFSVATTGGSTSESTPTTGGSMALILSSGVGLSPPLTGPEAIQVAIATSSDIRDPLAAWPGLPGWDQQYGFGRPNLARAVDAVLAGDIPPTPSLDAPSWYALYDPLVTHTVPVAGNAAARHGLAGWSVDYGLGADPTAYHALAAGTGGTVAATLDLSTIPESFWRAPFTISSSKSLPTNDQYTVTLRLRAWDADGRMGEDRRAIAVHHDDDLLPGFPMKLPASGESQPALVDVNGDGVLDIVFGDTDGNVHAIDARLASEISGFPVATHEPIIAPVAAGGGWIVATTTSGTTHVLDHAGHEAAAWPRNLAQNAAIAPIPRPALDFTRLPALGATACPVLFDLDRDGGLDVIQAEWDGFVYAVHLDGSPVVGWPVHVQLPADHKLAPGHSLVDDAKIDVTPAIADLDGDGRAEVIVQSQYLEVLDEGIQPAAISHVFAYHADGAPVEGWPVGIPVLVAYYGSAQEFITEGSTSPAAADVDGDGNDEVAVSGIFSPSLLLDGDGSIRAVYGPNPGVLGSAAELGDLPADAPVTFTTSGAFGRVAGTLAYAQAGSTAGSIAGALLLTGSGVAIQNVERAYDAATGASLPGFPAKLQGLDFLGAPLVVDVTGDGIAEIVDGADSSALHAFGPGGLQAAGWPKYTNGWTLFSPSAGDVDGDGRTDIVTVTREGYLFAWRTAGHASDNTQWWTYHHDAQRTGNYGHGPLATLPETTVRVGPAPAVALASIAPLLVAGLVVMRRRL